MKNKTKYGFWMGLIKLPSNLMVCIFLFPVVFSISYYKWYNGKKPKYHRNFLSFCYGVPNSDIFKLSSL